MKKITKKRILIAEDDKLISRAFKIGLEKAGFLVLIAFNGDEALKIIEDDKPDIVILDLVMPIRDGFDVLKEVRSNSSFEKMPIIVLSNLECDFSIQKAKNLGASEYLLKTNFIIEDVIKIINNYLK